MSRQSDNLEVLVAAPVGRDSKLIIDALHSVEILAIDIRDIDGALNCLAQQTIGALLVTEETLDAVAVGKLTQVLSNQPAWSELPVLILTIGGSSTTLSKKREQDRLPLGNVTLLERPIRMATLTSSVRSALRSRNRQYQVRDTLSERDIAEASRRETESRLLLAIETAQLGTWERNLTSGTLEASTTCRRIFDWPPEQTLSYRDLIERVHPEDQAAMANKVAVTTQEAVPYAAEYRIIWRDGSIRWISSRGRLVQEHSPADHDATVRMAGVVLDITDRVLSEVALREADKLALVGRLSSSIAHEINNPLESVTNLLYLLESSNLGDLDRQYVSTAQKELARVSEITAQTLTFNRQRNSYHEAVLSEILDSVLALYQGRFATSNITVHRRYTYNVPLKCYAGELRQVFANLIGNSFDATRQGGRILVRERLASHPSSGVRGVRITIADTGSGMTQAVRSRIFEAFHSTKGNNGTGLGLWISKGIIEKHGGSIRLSTSVAAGLTGTVFSIFLPIPTTKPKSSAN